MKRFFLFALVATMFAACVTDETQDVAVELAPDTLTVSFEGDDSRIQLQNGKTVWTQGDLVSVFYRSNANQKWQYQGKTGERTGNLKRVNAGSATETTSKVVVVYPYSEKYYLNPETCDVEAFLPAEQSYLKDSYGLDGNIMISSGYYNQFSLKNVCGWLKIQLKGEGQVVKKISLKGNNGEQVAGQIYINSATAEATLAAEMGGADDTENGAGGNLVFDDTILTEVTLDCGEGVTLSGDTSTFHIGLPPQTFEKGLTLTVHYSDDTTMSKSTSNSIDIARNTIQPMSTLYYDGNVPPVFELAYTTNDGLPLAPYTSDGFGANFIENVYNAATGQGALKFDGRITTIAEKAFVACNNLTSLSLTQDIKSIGAEAFSGCSSLATMNIPNSVTLIGNMAFYNCNSMQEITIPSSVTSIGSSSFEGCTGKAFINCKITGVSDLEYGKFYRAKFTEVIIGDTVTSIGDYAFRNCFDLTYITLPNSITWIGNQTFGNCYSLTNITIPDKVTFIDKYAFSHCTSLKDVKLGSKVSSIKEGAFSGCSSLESITIVGNNSLNIEGNVFLDCNNLKNVYYKGDFLNWYNIKFKYSDSNPLSKGAKLYVNGNELTELDIPIEISSFNDYAFNGCTSITKITIHNRLTSIGYDAFLDCINLKEVYCKAFTPPTGGGDYMFSYYQRGSYYYIGCKIYVPREVVDIYKSAENWKIYANYIVGYDF